MNIIKNTVTLAFTHLLDSQCNTSDVRLVDGSHEREGRIEVCFDGIWGTVCNGLWGASDASVVCRQLGFSPWGMKQWSNSYRGY